MLSELRLLRGVQGTAQLMSAMGGLRLDFKTAISGLRLDFGARFSAIDAHLVRIGATQAPTPTQNSAPKRRAASPLGEDDRAQLPRGNNEADVLEAERGPPFFVMGLFNANPGPNGRGGHVVVVDVLSRLVRVFFDSAPGSSPGVVELVRVRPPPGTAARKEDRQRNWAHVRISATTQSGFGQATGDGPHHVAGEKKQVNAVCVFLPRIRARRH